MNAEVTYNLLMRQNKSSMKKIMRLILEEVIIMSDVQMHSFLQYFLTLKKLS